MNQSALRYLSLGFLVSAVLLSGYRIFLYDPQTAAGGADSENTAELSDEELSYKERYEQLLAETEVANLTEEDSSADEGEESSDAADDEDQSENAEEDSSEEEEEPEEEIITATIVINDGQPSSVAANQLEDQGIIDNSSDFDQYLEENDFANLVRPGSYEVSSDMDYEEIANILMTRN